MPGELEATLNAAGSGTIKEDDCATSLPLLSTYKIQIAEGIDQQNMWSKKLKSLLFWEKKKKKPNKPEMSENVVLKLQIYHGIACLMWSIGKCTQAGSQWFLQLSSLKRKLLNKRNRPDNSNPPAPHFQSSAYYIKAVAQNSTLALWWVNLVHSTLAWNTGYPSLI